MLLISMCFTYSCGGGGSAPNGGGVDPPATIFSDDFSTNTTGNYTLIDTWTLGGTGSFLYDSVGKRGQVITGDNIGLQISADILSLDSATFLVDFLPTTSYPNKGGIWIRLRQDQSNYYQISNFDAVSTGMVEKIVNGVVVDSKAIPNLYSQNNNYKITFSFSPSEAILNAFGTSVTLDSNGSAINVSSVEIELRQQDAYIDNIIQTDSPVVTLTSPQSNDFQWNHTLTPQADAFNLPSGYGIKFILDTGTSSQRASVDNTKPFTKTFTLVDGGAHSVTAIAVDSKGIEVAGNLAWDQASNVVLGDYYVGMGDSITKGSHDNIQGDGIGYEPILENSLNSLLGYPHIVVNEGVSGHRSSDGVSLVSSLINSHPNSTYFLILYGSNDSQIAVSKASYKNNMESIIVTLQNNGKMPVLGKVPYYAACPSCNTYITQYNSAIDELVGLYGIQVTPPDFYNWYLNHQSELADGLHPNGVGYQSMANLWETALTN